MDHASLIKRLADGARVGVSLVLVVAVLMVFVGVLAFLGVLLRSGPF